MALADRVDQFRALTTQALHDLFDQDRPFGRLALVQVLMLAGDTLVTISLAGSLFFSISPGAAKTKVLLYLLLTLAPFAIVSPLLGPLIDRSRNARRAMVIFSALGRAVLCPFMARDIHSLLLFPEAFLILVLSKLYLVTRGALVPEMIAMTPGPGAAPAAGVSGGADALVDVGPTGDAFAPTAPTTYAALNARLTLLGTVAGFIVSVPGVILLKTLGAPAVLIFATAVFAAGAMAGARLPVRRAPRAQTRGRPPDAGTAVAATGAAPAEARAGPDAWARAEDPDLARLQPMAHPEVTLGLGANCALRGLAGFLIFMLAFGLRREHAALWWYGLCLGASGVGSITGLLVIPRLRGWLNEQQILLGALWFVAAGGVVAAYLTALPAQAGLAFVIGAAGSLGQPSFDALTQRYVPLAAQGRAFARFATRQQLAWVVGALIPVVVVFPLPVGDVVIAVVAAAAGLFYLTSRRALRHRALPERRERPAS